MDAGTRRIPDELLERYLVSVLDAEARAGVERLLSESEADRARLEALRAHSELFLARHPPGPVAARIHERLEAKRKRWTPWRWGALAMPALAMTCALLVLARPELEPAPREPDVIAKGGLVLRVHRKLDSGSAVVAPGERLAPGDAIRFEVHSATDGYLALLGRDASGKVLVYHPHGGPRASPHDASQAVLPEAFVLDDAPGPEEVYAFFSAEPFELTPLVTALEAGQELKGVLPGGVRMTSGQLLKRH